MYHYCMRKTTCFKSLVIVSFVVLGASVKGVLAVNENSSGNMLFKKSEAITSRSNEKTGTNENNQSGEPFSDLKDKVKQQRDAWIARKCELLTTSIDSRVTKFDENKNTHIEKYQRIKTSLQAIITKLEAKGYDVSELKEDLQTLDNKIKNFASDFAAFIEKLKATKSYACGESDGDFANALESAKSEIDTVRKDAEDIREFYRTVIRPDVEALKEQKHTEAGSENE